MSEDDDFDPWRPPARANDPEAGATDQWQPADPWQRSGPVWASPNPYAGAPDDAFGADTISSPHDRRPTTTIVAAIVVLALVVGGGVTFFALRSHGGATGQPAARPPASAGGPSAPGSALPSGAGSAPPSAQSTPPASASPSPGSAVSTGPLDSYLLAPADFGPGTAMQLIQGGRDSVNQATLDFCNYDYTSEQLRAVRVQVSYAGPFGFASNEFVKYQPGGASAAYAELGKAIASCPSTYRTASGEVVSNVEAVTGMAGLVRDHKVLAFQSSDGLNTTWTVAVYQFDGDYFSGVYVYGATSAAATELAKTLGADAAQHLTEAAAGRPGTGGGVIGGPDSGSQGGGAQV
jgi:hypothetical protein